MDSSDEELRMEWWLQCMVDVVVSVVVAAGLGMEEWTEWSRRGVETKVAW